jgi:hypothetical protein
MNLVAIKTKCCIQCGGEWDLEAGFRKNPHYKNLGASALAPREFRARCIGCELTDRNDPTPEERARRKASNTISLHAEKYGMKPIDFAKRYGWVVQRMIYDILHGLENTCCYCWDRYDRMGHGLDDITVDIVDRDREPYYSINVRWCCQTCNREKSAMLPELWARRLDFWRQYMPWRERIKADQTHGLPLFAEQFLPLQINARTITQ